MRVLVTGDAGLIGSATAAVLRGRGDEVVGFDKACGDDLADDRAVERAAKTCDAVVHCAAIRHDSHGTPSEIFATNVTGTWNVLRAAERAGVARFVYLSSAQVFGVFDPDGRAAYLPIDDDHPRSATRPYGLSKCFGEDLCASFTSRTGMSTVALRPVAVHDDAGVDARRRRATALAAQPLHDRAFVHVRDVVAAILLAVERAPGTHARLTLCADTPIGSSPGDPSPSAFDCSAAARVLGWRPVHDWHASSD